MGVYKRLERAENSAAYYKGLADKCQGAIFKLEAEVKAKDREVAELKAKLKQANGKLGHAVSEHKKRIEELTAAHMKAGLGLKKDAEDRIFNIAKERDGVKKERDFLLANAGYFLKRKYQKQFA